MFFNFHEMIIFLHVKWLYVFVHVKRGGNAPSPFLLLLMDVTQNKTKQNKTKQNKTKQNKTKQNKTKQNKTKRNETKRNETKRNEMK